MPHLVPGRRSGLRAHRWDGTRRVTFRHLKHRSQPRTIGPRVATGWLVFRLSGSDRRARFRPSSSPHLRACWWTLEPTSAPGRHAGIVVGPVGPACRGRLPWRTGNGHDLADCALWSVCLGIKSLARGLFHPAQGLRRTTENHAGCLVFYASECDRGRLQKSLLWRDNGGTAPGVLVGAVDRVGDESRATAPIQLPGELKPRSRLPP